MSAKLIIELERGDKSVRVEIKLSDEEANMTRGEIIEQFISPAILPMFPNEKRQFVKAHAVVMNGYRIG